MKQNVTKCTVGRRLVASHCGLRISVHSHHGVLVFVGPPWVFFRST